MKEKLKHKYHFKILVRNARFWLALTISVLILLAGITQNGAIAETYEDANIVEVEVEDFNKVDDIEQKLIEESIDESEFSDIDLAGQTGTLKYISFQPDTSIQKGLRILAARYKKNIVPSANVQGTIAAGLLYDVTFEEAMNAILGYQFKWEDDGKFVWVYTADEFEKIKMDKRRMISKVFTLYYINAEEVQKLILPALSDFGQVSATSSAERTTEAGDGGDSYAMRDSIIVYDFPENIEKIQEMLDGMDQRPPAIMLDVTIMQAVLNDKTEFGIDFSSIDGSLVTTLGQDGISTGGFAGSVTGTATGSGLSIGITSGNTAALVRALESITDTTILANPKIMALNKQAGHLLIGEENGYLTLTNVNADGATQQVEFLESGTLLDFRPFVCKDGYVRMEIYPEQSTGSVEVQGDFVLPNKSTTQLKTNVMVKDGQTIVIGGLFQDDIQKTYSQVPILGDLPFIGAAFRKTNDQAIRTELIVLMTPHIIDDPEKVEASERFEDVDRMMHGAHKSLEWLNRTRLMEDRFAEAVRDYKQGNYEQALCELNYILEMRPRYHDAIKLREKIIKERVVNSDQVVERIMLDKFKQENY